MAYICYHALTDEELVIVAKRFKKDLLISGFTHQSVADKLEVAQSTIAAWSNGRLLIPIWRALDLQKKTKETTDELFRVGHLRPDLLREFPDEIKSLWEL